jgi:hypothetical protein
MTLKVTVRAKVPDRAYQDRRHRVTAIIAPHRVAKFGVVGARAMRVITQALPRRLFTAAFAGNDMTTTVTKALTDAVVWDFRFGERGDSDNRCAVVLKRNARRFHIAASPSACDPAHTVNRSYSRVVSLSGKLGDEMARRYQVVDYIVDHLAVAGVDAFSVSPMPLSKIFAMQRTFGVTSPRC